MSLKLNNMLLRLKLLVHYTYSNMYSQSSMPPSCIPALKYHNIFIVKLNNWQLPFFIISLHSELVIAIFSMVENIMSKQKLNSNNNPQIKLNILFISEMTGQGKSWTGFGGDGDQDF